VIPSRGLGGDTHRSAEDKKLFDASPIRFNGVWREAQVRH
jgi:hypothetical protein